MTASFLPSCAPSARALECAHGTGGGDLRHSWKSPGAGSRARGRSTSRRRPRRGRGRRASGPDASRDARLSARPRPARSVHPRQWRSHHAGGRRGARGRRSSRARFARRVRWNAEQLNPADVRRSTVARDIACRTSTTWARCCSATRRRATTPRSSPAYTPEDRLFRSLNLRRIAGRLRPHPHAVRPHDRATRVVNAGSVGMPFGEPGAYWLLLGPGVELRHTSTISSAPPSGTGDELSAGSGVRRQRHPAPALRARDARAPRQRRDQVGDRRHPRVRRRRDRRIRACADRVRRPRRL